MTAMHHVPSQVTASVMFSVLICGMLDAREPDLTALRPVAGEESGVEGVTPLKARFEDQRLHDLVHDGLRRSSLLRTLVSRLQPSDVIVYVRCDERPPAGIVGRVSFVSRIAGRRYLLARVKFVGDPDRQIAVIGHELQHALEIAGTPEIVDTTSLLREYSRFGYVRRVNTKGVTEFETDAALEAGRRILEELRNGGR